MMDIPVFHTTDEYVEWATNQPGHKFNWMWCPRHWAPVVVNHYNGLLASMFLMHESLDMLPPNVKGAAAANSYNENQTVSVCCKLGDEKMDHLWGILAKVTSGNVCAASAPLLEKYNGRHACFFDKGHTGPHDFNLPVQSIFDYTF